MESMSVARCPSPVLLESAALSQPTLGSFFLLRDVGGELRAAAEAQGIPSPMTGSIDYPGSPQVNDYSCTPT